MTLDLDSATADVWLSDLENDGSWEGGKNVGGSCACCTVVAVASGGVDNDADGLGRGVSVSKESRWRSHLD